MEARWQSASTNLLANLEIRGVAIETSARKHETRAPINQPARPFPLLQPVQHRGFVRPHAAPPPELLVNSVDLPSIIGRARSNTVSTPQTCPLDARATLQYVRRQVSRLERENAELQAENVCLQASNKRLRSENAHLQDDNAGLQRAASEARLDNWQKLHESDRQLEAAQSTTESLRAALEDAKQELAHRTTAMSELRKNLDVANGVVQAVCTQQQDAFAASLQRAHCLTREASQRRKQPGPPASPAEPSSRRASEPVEPVEAYNYNLTSNAAAACRAMTPAWTAQVWKMRVTPPSHPSSRADGGRPSAAALPAARVSSFPAMVPQRS